MSEIKSRAEPGASSPRRPKLLYVATEDWYFASDTLPLAVAASACGYDVGVATRVTNHAGVIADAGIKVHPLGRMSRSAIGPFSQVRSFAELKALYERETPDIVHHIALKPVILGSRAARSVGIGGVVNSIMGLGYVFTAEDIKARALRPLVAAMLKSTVREPSVRTIVQNNDDRTELAKIAGVSADKIQLIRGSGVDIERFAPTPLPAGIPLIILPGRMLREKGVYQFVDAARQLKKQGVVARFALVGASDPDNPNSIKPEVLQAWAREGAVEVWGYRVDIVDVIKQASVVCLPAFREGLPRILIEAAASARAVITTDVPGCRDVVEHGRSGWLVPASDVAQLRAALAEAIANPTICQTFGARGRQLVTQHFSSKIIIGQTLEVYSSLRSRFCSPSTAHDHPS